jgi:hypothetical protein
VSNPIDPLAAAQLREVAPDREEVVTWHRFRALVFIMRDQVTQEETNRVVEFRTLDGTQVHQFVLDDDVRRMLLEALAYDESAKLVLPHAS